MSSYLDRIRVPRLGVNRHGVYYVRWSALDASGRRQVSQRSLGTKNVSVAKLLALQFCLSLANAGRTRVELLRYEFDPVTGTMKADGPEDHRHLMEAVGALANLRRLEGDLQLRATVPQDQALLEFLRTLPEKLSAALLAQIVPATHQAVPPTAAAGGTMRLAGGMTLKAAFAQHLAEERRRDKTKETVNEKAAVYRDFVNYFGDVPVSEITESDIGRRWREAEFNRPNQKRADDLLGLNRLEKRRGYLSRFFDWAKSISIYPYPNPMSSKMATKSEIKSQSAPWTPFSDEDLSHLFNESFATEMNKPDWYWIPLMALFSGARLGELANLALTDFEIHDNVKVYLIRKGKTAQSRRIVPVHSTLLQLGLWEYVLHLRSIQETHLFPHRPPDKRGKSVGREWGIWVDHCGIKDKTKVFHSFRSTVVTDMYSSQAPNPAAIRDAVGHAGGMKGVHGEYARGLPMPTLVATIERLQYDPINFDRIKLKDPTFKTFFEEMVREREARARLVERSAKKRGRTSVSAKKPAESPVK